MSVAEFELIVLDNGDVGLRRIGGDEPLVRVKFSSEVKEYLGDQQIAVAKSMIDEGIKTVYQLEREVPEDDELEPHPTVH